MTTPQPAVFTERFANMPDPFVTVPAGAPTTPPANTVETWVVEGGWAGYPVADPTVSQAHPLPELFRVADLDEPTEVVRVIDTRTAGVHSPTWRVARADQGRAVPHRAGFTVGPAINGAALGGRAQGVPSGGGLVIPNGVRKGSQMYSGAGPGPPANGHTLASLLVPGGEAVNGSLYECVSWGYINTNRGTGKSLELGFYWGTAQIGFNAWPIYLGPLTGNQHEDGVRWRFHSLIAVHNGAAFVNHSLILARRNDPNTEGDPYMTGPLTNNGNAIVTATDQTLRHYGISPQVASGAAGVNCQGARLWRAA